MSCRIGGILHRLSLSVLYFELLLHFEIGLAFPLDSLLFHVSNDTSMHRLEMFSIIVETTSAVEAKERKSYTFLNRLTVMNKRNDAGGA